MIVIRRGIVLASLGAPLLFGAARRALAAGPLVVLCSTSMRPAAEVLAPRFTAAGGQRAELRYAPALRLRDRIMAGEGFDVAVLTPALMEELAGAGKLAPGSARPVARSGVGVAVRRGAPKPDISSVAAFRAALLAAPSVAHSTAGQSNIAFQAVLERLGIAAEVRAKARPSPDEPTGELVARGEAALAVQQIPELMAVPGAELVGPFPPELQSWTRLSAGIASETAEPAAARAFIAALTTPEAAAVLREKGLEPA